jgi:hypothetical protein
VAEKRKPVDNDKDGFYVGEGTPAEFLDQDDNNPNVGVATASKDLAAGYVPQNTFSPSISLTSPQEATADINAVWMEQFGKKAPAAVVNAYSAELRSLQSGRVSGLKSGDNKTTVNIQGVSASEIKALQAKYLTAAATDLVTKASAGDAKAVANLQKGNFGLTYTTLKNAYAENGLPVNVKALGKLSVESAANPELLKSNISLINMQAATYYPALAKQINKGYTVKQLLSPYINSRANILEEDPDMVDIKNLTSVAKDPNGLMGLYDYEISLRKDPKWRFTKNAQDTLSSVASGIAKTFGLLG